MTSVLMISLDATLFNSAIGDARARHVEYARRTGQLAVVVCTRGSFAPLTDGALRLQATGSKSRLHYMPDGCRVGRKLAAKHRPDVIVSQDAFLTGLIGLRLKRTLGAPLIVQDHSSVLVNPIFARERPLNRILQLLARQVIRRADAVRVVNTAERAACIRLGVPAAHVSVIPVATDLARFAQLQMPNLWRARLGIAETDPMALWVGRPVPFKNLPLLLAAFKQVAAERSNARLVLAGDMSGSAIPALIAQLGLSQAVKLAGRVPHADLPALYQSANAYIHSSDYEGFGLVLVEAAAAGLPLISTETDGARDIIRDGETGLFVPHRAEALAGALLTLFDEPARAQAMGTRAQADMLTRFDPALLRAQWVDLWQSVAAR